MRVPGRAVLAAALLWTVAAPSSAAQELLVVQAPDPALVQSRDGARIRVVGGPAIDTGALGLVAGRPVYAEAPGAAEVVIPADQMQPALVALAHAAMTGCEALDFDVRPVMRQLEKGPWAPFVDLRVSEDTGATQVLLKGETGMRVVSDAQNRRSKSIQLSMSSTIQTLDGVRTRAASCGILMIATDESFPDDWVDEVFAKRRLGEPQVFSGGETWQLGPPAGLTWPEDRRGRVSILRSPGNVFSVRYSLYQPTATPAS